MAERLGHDLTGDPRFRPGFAPDSWTALATHLRGNGFTDAEMVAAGVATTASTGRLIDRFRGRIVFPVMHDGEVLGFVGRRHPDATDSRKAGPKYLNTPETILFHKGAQLFGTADETMTLGSVPVIVEGPMDAIAVTLATGGAYLGVAPLGTSLTDQQTRQLAQFDHDPIVATDGDLAGQVAAERDYWILTLHGLNPRHADLGQGADPASLLADHGPTPLRSALHHAGPLAETLLDERLTNIVDPDQAVRDAAAVIAALPPARWASGIDRIAEHVHAPTHTVEQAVAAAAHQWTSDQRKTATSHLTNTAAVRARLEAATQTSPTQMSPTGRWAVLAGELDPRLTSQRDWPVTAQMIQDVHDAGHDVRALAHDLVGRDPLTDRPAQDLRYRLVSYLPEESMTEITATPPAEDKRRLSAAAREHERTRPMQRPIDGPRR